MKNRPLFTLILLAISFMSSPAMAIEAGSALPNFTLKTAGGQEVSLSDYRGKYVLIDFWTAWCSKCQRSLDWLSSLQQKINGDNLQILTINLDETSEDAEELLAKKGLNLLVAYDPKGNTPVSYEIEDTPASLVVDPSGKLVLLHTGFDSEIGADLEQKILKLLGGNIEGQQN